ncbi:NUT family member 2F [Cavia porcellus]|uniref:NUT family member 2F n=1 Tax=Cavia porcellus TaxID=10141 RepID=UPI002FE1FB93
MTGELQGCPLPVPLGPDPPRPPVLQDVQQPVHDPRQTNSKEQAACPPAHKCQQSQETQVPGDIPDDAVKEYMEIMDWLEDHHLLATGEPEENQEEGQQQEEEEMYPDLDLLSYLDELCSQEDFISKVEAIINPQFLVEAESEDVEKDIILAVGQVLEDEHGFTPEQLVEKRLLGSKVQEGVYRPSSPTAPQPAALQDAERDDHEPKQRVSKEACTPPKASQVLKRCRAIDEDLPGSEVPPVLHRRQSPAPLGAFSHNALPQDLAPQCALGLRNTSPTPGLWDPASSLGEDEEDFSSLSFLLASPRQLLPWELSQTPGPDVGLQGPNGPAPQASPPQGGGLSPGLPLPARSKKRVRLGGSAPVGKRSRLGPSYEVSGGQDLAQGQVPLSGPQKRQCNKLGSQRWRKKH